jgi:hypothetical protein
MVLYGILIVVTIVTFGIGFFLPLILWIYGLYDAYNTANKINAGTVVV